MLRVVLISMMFFCTTVLLDAKADVDQPAKPAAPAVADKRVPLSYSGWAVIKRQHLDPAAKDDEWLSMRGLSMTDDGQILKLMDGETPTPYSLELIVITYEKTNTTVVKLALYEEGKERAITYIWGEPGAGRLGMNLRWMQAGFTLNEG